MRIRTGENCWVYILHTPSILATCSFAAVEFIPRLVSMFQAILLFCFVSVDVDCFAEIYVFT